MHIKIKQIVLVFLCSLCMGLLASIMVTNRTVADINAGGNFLDCPEPYVDPAAMRQFEENQSEITIILVLRSELSPDPGSTEKSEYDFVQYRKSIVNLLQQDFQNSKRSIAPILTQASQDGNLLEQRDLWLVNGMALRIRPPLFQQLMSSPAVEGIYLDNYQQYLYPNDSYTDTLTLVNPGTEQTAWGIERVQVPMVWRSFGISGTGAVIAIMDTGVDFLHPVLSNNYRGNIGKGIYTHYTSWFDAINQGFYPYDDQGHGSHVAGTAVGAENIGVAPGAQWIGVKVLDTNGFGYDSWILDGFQWLMAPAGDPSLAPDVINASWSSANSTNTVFEQAIQTLTDAGILIVVAAGNEGPVSGSVGSPASYRGVLAVGASDQDDDVTSFSGRGPSPWREIKPYVVAPGVNILSALPGGVYAVDTGTSMATPHVAGLAATLRGVSPTLSVPGMINVITSTARPVSITVPNNESGWGIIDAYAAVVRLVEPAIIKGTVKDIMGQNIYPSTVDAISLSEPGLVANATTDAEGHYALALNPGIYNLVASSFGFYPQEYPNLEAVKDLPLDIDFVLSPLPVGELTGHIYISNTGELITESMTITLLGTPVTAVSSLSGNFHMDVPQGAYTLTVQEVGYHSIEMSVTVQAGETVTRDIYLAQTPRILLVDEGLWYYDSQRFYWIEALDALRYTYDLHPIKHPPVDTPGASELKEYDIVLWSSPRGSPGLVGGAEPLQDYLLGGGRLLVSGQEVAYFDAGGRWDVNPQSYIYDLLGVAFKGELSIDNDVIGKKIFEGLTYSIYGSEGADNQVSPDIVQIRDPDVAAFPWTYAGGEGAGSAVDICTPYRALYFGFGFEAIAGSANRREVMERSLDWLALDPLTTGLTLDYLNKTVQIGRAGTRLTHTLSLRHIGISGIPEVITMTILGGSWSNEILPYSHTISPCTSININVVVTIPLETGIHVTDWMTLTAVSNQVNTSATVVLETKTPAPVLLVDDDRWYSVEDKYIQVLENAGIFFDIWDNQDNLGGVPGIRSPQTETLNLYPVLIWFTGYDWYRPIVDTELDALVDYLEHDGRLILSSQDFLFYHEKDSLAARLGIKAESDGQDIVKLRSTLHPASGVWKSVQLEYPFPLHTDIVEPAPGVVPIIRGDSGQPVAVAAKQPSKLHPSTLFYGFPLEALPVKTRQEVLARAVGWLSPVGESDWNVYPATATAGDRLHYMLVLRNNRIEMVAVSAEHYIPEGQFLHVPSLPEDWVYHANTKSVEWQGNLLPGQVLTYVWETDFLFDMGISQYPSVTLSISDWGLKFGRFAHLPASGPDLGYSTWLTVDDENLYTGDSVTSSLLLQNNSQYPGAIHAAVWMMEGVTPVTDTSTMTDSSHGWYVPLWEGSMSPYEVHTLTLPAQVWAWEGPVRMDALLSDTRGSYWEIPLWIDVKPWGFYLPLNIK